MKDHKNILRGDYADPSIVRVNDDYYLVASTFEYYPALTVWHSKNLEDWSPICHAAECFTGNVEAPDICYYEGRFYIYYPAYGTNYVIYADDIKGPWSKPIDLKIPHIDPGHCVGEDGKRYLYLSQGNCVQLADDGLSVVGEIKKLYDGWPIPQEWTTECFALEAPKLIKKNGYFYMLSAEGGTSGPATSHMVVAARSKSILGPWEECPNNPIIRTQSDTEKWWSQGHGTMFDTVQGDWYIVYHGYEKGYHTLGRQTLLSQIIWTDDGWFYAKEIENHDVIDEKRQVFLDLNDDFRSDKLKWQWRFFGAYDVNRLTFDGDGMRMSAKSDALKDTSPLLCTPYSHSYELKVTVETENKGVEAGLCLFYSDLAYCFVGASLKEIYNGTMVNRRITNRDSSSVKTFLKLINTKNIVTFYYSLDGESWTKLIPTKDVSGFHHNTFGRFFSLKTGLYCVGDDSAKFSDFRYTHIE